MFTIAHKFSNFFHNFPKFFSIFLFQNAARRRFCFTWRFKSRASRVGCAALVVLLRRRFCSPSPSSSLLFFGSRQVVLPVHSRLCAASCTKRPRRLHSCAPVTVRVCVCLCASVCVCVLQSIRSRLHLLLYVAGNICCRARKQQQHSIHIVAASKAKATHHATLSRHSLAAMRCLCRTPAAAAGLLLSCSPTLLFALRSSLRSRWATFVAAACRWLLLLRFGLATFVAATYFAAAAACLFLLFLLPANRVQPANQNNARRRRCHTHV